MVTLVYFSANSLISVFSVFLSIDGFLYWLWDTFSGFFVCIFMRCGTFSC